MQVTTAGTQVNQKGCRGLTPKQGYRKEVGACRHHHHRQTQPDLRHEDTALDVWKHPAAAQGVDVEDDQPQHRRKRQMSAPLLGIDGPEDRFLLGRKSQLAESAVEDLGVDRLD
jgi:hypothetical protein